MRQTFKQSDSEERRLAREAARQIREHLAKYGHALTEDQRARHQRRLSALEAESSS